MEGWSWMSLYLLFHGRINCRVTAQYLSDMMAGGTVLYRAGAHGLLYGLIRSHVRALGFRYHVEPSRKLLLGDEENVWHISEEPGKRGPSCICWQGAG